MHTYTRGCTWTCASEGLKSGWKRRVRLERDTRPTAYVLCAKISIRPALRTLQNRFWEKVRLFCSLRGLLTKYGDLNEILSSARSREQFSKSFFGFPNRTTEREIQQIRIWISYLKSTLRTDFSEVKSVFGFRVRLGNPDFPIERTLGIFTS